jgi:hypothetical protein
VRPPLTSPMTPEWDFVPVTWWDSLHRIRESSDVAVLLDLSGRAERKLSGWALEGIAWEGPAAVMMSVIVSLRCTDSEAECGDAQRPSHGCRCSDAS